MNKKETHNETESALKSLPWVAGALFVLGLAVISGFYWSSELTVQKIRYTGNYFVSSEELQNIEIPAGVSPDSINFIEITDRIEKIPYVKRAEVSLEPSGNLLISISERKPLAMLSDGSQKIYVDRYGHRLPMIRGKTADVPILYGFSTGPVDDTLKSKSFDATADFLSTIGDRPVSDATISEIAWTESNGIVAITNQNGVKLIFGKNDFNNRLRNWEAFYGDVVKEKGMEQMRSIDLRFRGQIVTREG